MRLVTNEFLMMSKSWIINGLIRPASKLVERKIPQALTVPLFTLTDKPEKLQVLVKL